MTLSLRSFFIFIFLCAGVLWLENSPLDFWIQDFFYDPHSKTWLISRDNAVLRIIFYTGIKNVITLFAVGLLLNILFFFYQKRFLDDRHKGYAIVLLSIIITPLLAVLIKELTYVHCPSRLLHYGGPSEFRSALDFSPLHDLYDRGKCFPAGHASGGFALMALYFMSSNPRYQKIGLAVGLMIGWMMSLYQMLKGAHFLSHSLAIMLLSWLVIVVIARLLKRY